MIFVVAAGYQLQKLAKKKNVKLEDLMQELANIDNQGAPAHNYKEWDLDFLADYIVNTHHKYVTENLTLLEAYTEKVARVHGESHPPLIEIRHLFLAVNDELTTHMQKEERILFPFIKKMVQAKNENTTLEEFPFGSVNNPY